MISILEFLLIILLSFENLQILLHNLSVSRFSDPSTIKNFPPKLSTCSFDVGSHISCKYYTHSFCSSYSLYPVTPAPTTKTFAAGIVPAAVIIMGIAFSKDANDSITALYPAKLA